MLVRAVVSKWQHILLFASVLALQLVVGYSYESAVGIKRSCFHWTFLEGSVCPFMAIEVCSWKPERWHFIICFHCGCRTLGAWSLFRNLFRCCVPAKRNSFENSQISRKIKNSKTWKKENDKRHHASSVSLKEMRLLPFTRFPTDAVAMAAA